MSSRVAVVGNEVIREDQASYLDQVIRGTVDQLRQGTLALSKALFLAQRSLVQTGSGDVPYYRAHGFDTWRDYLEQPDIQISPSKANYLIGICSTVIPALTREVVYDDGTVGPRMSEEDAEEVVSRVDDSKFGVIVPQIRDGADPVELLLRAQDTSYRQLKATLSSTTNPDDPELPDADWQMALEVRCVKRKDGNYDLSLTVDETDLTRFQVRMAPVKMEWVEEY